MTSLSKVAAVVSLAASTLVAATVKAPAQVEVRIDWSAFLARHDPIWEVLPAKFDHGAFLVSALRQNGKTRWVRIKSLAGEPCIVRPAFDGAFRLSDPSISQRECSPGVYELGLRQNQEVLLFQEPVVSPDVAPCVLPPETYNFFGVKAAKTGAR